MELSASRPGVLEELGAPLRAELQQALAQLGAASAVVHGRARGGTSTCYFVATQPVVRSLVLKCPFPGEDLTEEYAALCDAAALGTALGMQLPKPVAWLSREHGYLMERLHGDPLRSGRSLSDGRSIATTAEAILAALGSYHREMGCPYGDFHAANVLVQADGRLAFIDPGRSADIARVTSNWLPATPLASDLGLWLYNNALDTPSIARSSPATATRLFRLSVEMVRIAAPNTPHDGRADDAFEVAFRHARRLWTDPWPSRRLKAPAVWLALVALRSAANTKKVVG